MTKAKFFELLANAIKFHSNSGDNYTAQDFEVHEFHDPKENAPKDWIHHAAGYVLHNCWYVCVTIHRTHAAAAKQAVIFARWIAEFKEIEAAKESEKKENDESVTVINIADIPVMDEARYQWLKNRFAMFWGGCDDATRKSMIEAAHDEGLRINATLIDNRHRDLSHPRKNQ